MSAVLGKNTTTEGGRRGKRGLASLSGMLLMGVSGLVLAGCVGDLSSGNRKSSNAFKPVVSETSESAPHINHETKFSSAEFGVKGSPRVTTEKRPRKGGGRYQIGKPYKVKGRWYKPEHDPDLKQVGLASWYGPNFHGRLTANGEIYDQYALTAAHPTMPLPSYATVTNLENGRKVTVRVNDRGPFSRNRVIDLSARAAKLLGYDHQGIAKVKVEYQGKARMDGLDEPMLMASYVGPANDDPGAPQENQSGSGTMLAMSEPVETIGPSEAISSSFATSDLALTGSTVGIPTARPTIFEGIPFDDNADGLATVNAGSPDGSQPTVYRIKPVVAGPVPVNALSYLADSAQADPSDNLREHIRELRKLSVPYFGEAPHNQVTLQLGYLQQAAIEAVRLILSDLSGSTIEFTENSSRLTVLEADANTALVRLKAAGLDRAFVQ